MRIRILLDNNTLIDRYFLGEPGFSAWLEADGRRILFDTGYSDAFLYNAQRMEIDPLTADMIVLSHGHLDHTWGLLPLMRRMSEAEFHRPSAEPPAPKPEFVAHPDALERKAFAPAPRQIGNVISRASLADLFDLRLSAEPAWLSEHVLFLGEIPRRTAFEPAAAIGSSTDGPDLLRDDTALAVRTAEGLVILTGCSHAGIGNIVQYARECTGEARVRDIIGGFHLLNPSPERLQGTTDFLASLCPAAVHACHCTDLRAKIALAQRLPLEEVGSGMVLEYAGLRSYWNDNTNPSDLRNHPPA
ncbi:MAG: MBL fold metallo-hydrolase [Anaerolineae bacterium]|nr:MBL fold metallo-hydrolase [Anaerolineae bacterium]